MCKPRFPLSVEREFIYRALIDSDGTILTSDSFKSVYRHARTTLKTNVKYLETEYRHDEAVFQFGYYTTYWTAPGRAYTEFTCLHDYGCLQVSSLSEWFYSTEDESNHCISGVEEV